MFQIFVITITKLFVDNAANADCYDIDGDGDAVTAITVALALCSRSLIVF